MVTGDLHHTAIAVARDVGMIPPREHLIIVQSRSGLQGEAHTAAQLQPPSLLTHNTASVQDKVRITQHPGKPSDTGSSFLVPSCAAFTAAMRPHLSWRTPSTHPPGAEIPSSVSMSSFEHMTKSVPTLNVKRTPKSLSWHGVSKVHPELSSQHASDSNRQFLSEQVLSEQGNAASVRMSHLDRAISGSCNSASTDMQCGPVNPTPLQDSTAQKQLAEPLQHSSLGGFVFMLQSEDYAEELAAQHAITSLAQV